MEVVLKIVRRRECSTAYAGAVEWIEVVLKIVRRWASIKHIFALSVPNNTEKCTESKTEMAKPNQT